MDDSRCKWCCAKSKWPGLASWPKPCLNCGVGLVHCYPDVEDFDLIYRCDSCDRWCYKSDRAPQGVHDCLCVFDRDRPWPACPHDHRGPQGAQGMVGRSREGR